MGAASLSMRSLWPTSKRQRPEPSHAAQPGLFDASSGPTGEPSHLPVDRIDEDPSNPRTEFSDLEIDELADDVRQHGILQPIVVHPADSAGRYRIHFGAKRLRAALLAGLDQVPVVVRVAPADAYAQVAENQKRHGLTPLDLARFIRGRVDAGDSNTEVARRLGMNLTTVAHHLALLDLPPELDQAMRAGRCTSPRTLHELRKLHDEQPEQVRALVAGDTEITRSALAAIRAMAAPSTARSRLASPRTTPLDQAGVACTRLEQALDRLARTKPAVHDDGLIQLRRRIAELAARLP
jgi:ParB family transcriptional regulator, chromosome partitioning protein